MTFVYHLVYLLVFTLEGTAGSLAAALTARRRSRVCLLNVILLAARLRPASVDQPGTATAGYV